MPNKYGILEGHFYIEGRNFMAMVKYRNRETNKLITKTVNMAYVRKDLNLDVNNFLARIVKEVEVKEDLDLKTGYVKKIGQSGGE